MTTPAVVGLALATLVYVVALVWMTWFVRVLRLKLAVAKEQRDDLIPCAMVCLAIGHQYSPAPRVIKEQANAAVPAWIRESTSTTVMDAASAFADDAMHPRRTH